MRRPQKYKRKSLLRVLQYSIPKPVSECVLQWAEGYGEHTPKGAHAKIGFQRGPFPTTHRMASVCDTRRGRKLGGEGLIRNEIEKVCTMCVVQYVEQLNQKFKKALVLQRT